MKPDSVVVRGLLSAPDMHDMQHMNHAEQGMGGLILGITVKPSAEWKPYRGPRERFKLYIQTDSVPTDTLRTFGYALARDGEPEPVKNLRWPGPTIVLHKGRPTSIWVINHALEPSQVHWHGLELDSYYDGVAGFSSGGGLLSPMIMPNDSFEVTVTPPRAGSFMYHTHVNDIRQQSRGLYGSIIVLDSAETWDPARNLIFQMSTDPQDTPILNGSHSPPEITIHAGAEHRLRLMNITLDNPFLEYRLVRNGLLVSWTSVAKDGHDLPPWQRVSQQARQRVSIGETHDFTVTFPDTGSYVLEAHGGSGVLFAKQAIHVIH
jgi:FtsP/CotA-like multicopper oxidase with cupredoxin domain